MITCVQSHTWFTLKTWIVQCRSDSTGAIKQLLHLQRPAQRKHEKAKATKCILNIVSTNIVKKLKAHNKLIPWPFVLYHGQCLWTKKLGLIKVHTNTSLQCVTAKLPVTDLTHQHKQVLDAAGCDPPILLDLQRAIAFALVILVGFLDHVPKGLL